MKIAIDTKNYSELIKWAKAQNLDVQHGRTSGDELIAKIHAVFPDLTEVEIEGEPETVMVVSGETGALTANYRHDPKVIVNIASDSENGGSHPVPVCVNGDHILIKRNADVAIPYRFYVALNNAVQTDLRQETNEQTGKIYTVFEERQAIRFSSKGVPSDDEIAAWHKRTRDEGRNKAEIEALKPAAAPVSAEGADLVNRLAAMLGKAA